MANPRVFVSLSCYDLSQGRDTLVNVITSFGFEAVLSDRGDVFYHPDTHTHDSCLNEVSNCDLMVLIIGGRFGGSYVAEPEKSIVNAEYAAAREKNIPVFTFVKRNVHSDHFLYTKNRGKDHLGSIIFPSIGNNAHAEKIFGFIDEVRRAPKDNAFFTFDLARELIDLLRKQWAGMFYDFLQERERRDQSQVTTNLLTNISVAGEKIEDLVKRLYQHVDSTGAEATIKAVEIHSAAKSFFDDCDSFTDYGLEIDPAVSPSNYEKWYEYLAAAVHGSLRVDSEDERFINLELKGDNILGFPRPDFDDCSDNFTSIQQRRFEIMKPIDNGVLRAVISEVAADNRDLRLRDDWPG